MKILASRTLDIPASLDNRSLKQQLAQQLPNLPRRVDRLTWQCLLAAAPLADRLRPSCGVYLASHYPSRDTMTSLLNNVCIKQLQPMPFEFINSVSNAAGFYLARQFGLDGPNLCLGSHSGIWPQLLQLAHADLSTDQATQALLINCQEDIAGNSHLQTLLMQGRAGCDPIQLSVFPSMA